MDRKREENDWLKSGRIKNLVLDRDRKREREKQRQKERERETETGGQKEGGE